MSYEISKFEVLKLGPNASIQPGFAFKSERFTDNENDTPLVKGENVHQGYIDWLGAKRWPRDECEPFAKYHLAIGDIVLAMDRPWVTAGLKWSFIKPHDPKSLLVQRVARLRAKGKLDQTYLRHVISSNYFANYLQPIVTGVNVPHISGKQIGDFRIPIPDLLTQRKIAAILTAYDDLIEANKRRIALLEKMAEELYREWFVRMRFPGHQNTRFVKGVPAGWEVAALNDFCEKVTDGTHDTPKPADSGHLLITGKNIRNHQVDFTGAYFISEKDHREISKRSGLKEWDILYSNIGTIGQTAIVGASPDYSVKNVIIFRPRNAHDSLFLFHVLKNPAISEHLLAMSSGASQQFIGLGTAREFKILTPNPTEIEMFGQTVSKLYEQRSSLIVTNQILDSLRDLLLPRLISGQLSVEDLDIRFPPSMCKGAAEPEATHA